MDRPRPLDNKIKSENRNIQTWIGKAELINGRTAQRNRNQSKQARVEKKNRGPNHRTGQIRAYLLYINNMTTHFIRYQQRLQLVWPKFHETRRPTSFNFSVALPVGTRQYRRTTDPLKNLPVTYGSNILSIKLLYHSSILLNERLGYSPTSGWFVGYRFMTMDMEQHVLTLFKHMNKPDTAFNNTKLCHAGPYHYEHMVDRLVENLSYPNCI